MPSRRQTSESGKRLTNIRSFCVTAFLASARCCVFDARIKRGNGRQEGVRHSSSARGDRLGGMRRVGGPRGSAVSSEAPRALHLPGGRTRPRPRPQEVGISDEAMSPGNERGRRHPHRRGRIKGVRGRPGHGADPVSWR